MLLDSPMDPDVFITEALKLHAVLMAGPDAPPSVLRTVFVGNGAGHIYPSHRELTSFPKMLQMDPVLEGALPRP